MNRLTVNEIAEKYGVSKQRVYQWLKQGLKHTRQRTIGKRTAIVVKPEDLAAFLTKDGKWLYKS